MSAVPRLNAVFLGCGRIAATHARTLARFRDRVRCFYASRDRERAMDYERRFRGAGSFGSYETALADGSMDVAVVTTPPASHLELTLAALQNGKHVIVEKPAFLRSTDFDVVREKARAARRRVLVAENYAYKPLALALRRLLAAGAVGELRFVRVSAVKQQSTLDWRDDGRLAGGGALFEGGVHWLDLLAHLGPEVRTVRAFRPGRSDDSVERGLLVVLQYADGSVGTLHHSWEVPSPLGGLGLSRIDGTAGTIVFESNGLFVLHRGQRTSLRLPGFRDLLGYQAMFADFFHALTSDHQALMTLERARLGVELALEAYASLEAAAPRAPSTGRFAWCS